MLGGLAHARRYFHEALEDRRAAWCVRQIGHLYGVEKSLREQRAGPQLREAVRTWQARPVLVRLEKMLRAWQPQVLPQSLLGKAIGYALERWSELCRYVEHGRTEIDNNWCENVMRISAQAGSLERPARGPVEHPGERPVANLLPLDRLRCLRSRNCGLPLRHYEKQTARKHHARRSLGGRFSQAPGTDAIPARQGHWRPAAPHQ